MTLPLTSALTALQAYGWNGEGAHTFPQRDWQGERRLSPPEWMIAILESLRISGEMEAYPRRAERRSVAATMALKVAPPLRIEGARGRIPSDTGGAGVGDGQDEGVLADETLLLAELELELIGGGLGIGGRRRATYLLGVGRCHDNGCEFFHSALVGCFSKQITFDLA